MNCKHTNHKQPPMHHIKIILLLALNILWSIILVAQPEFIHQIEIHANASKISVSAFKAIAFNYPKALEAQLEVKISDKVYQLTKDEHLKHEDGFFKSKLLVFDEWQTELQLLGLPKNQTVSAFLIATPSIELSHEFKKLQADSCGLPPIIPQEIWRKALPQPDYTRIPNVVSHQIIHHSASQNSLTDYTNLVRSIYLYHTEVNGWSDIGYNYLVAPDGSVFAGRDPGDFLDQDAVLGAHFCGSNTSTMGICMLGTFTEITPTALALKALEQILVWKSAKENLDPLSHLPHPLNQSLGTIAGHRDGCATLCPGDSLYMLLPIIRQSVLNQLYNCEIFPSVPESETAAQQFQIFPNPIIENKFTVKASSKIQEIIVYSVEGEIVESLKSNKKEITVFLNKRQSAAVFFVQIRLSNQLIFTRKLVFARIE